jgi:hypothetical protein
VDSFYDEGVTLNKYSSGNSLYGIDPRGWARLMFNRTPAGYTFNDYIYTSQTVANSKIVYGIRTTGEPVGVLVAASKHAILAVGFQSTRDPQSGLPWSLEGFKVVDPWYNGGSLTLSGAAYNLQPNSYIAISAWNSSYFKLYNNPYNVNGTGQPNVIWGPDADGDKFYTLVLRKDSTTQSPVEPWNAAPPYSDSRVVAPQSAMEIADDATYASVEDAVAGGIEANRLQDDAHLGTSLTGVSTGEVVVVESLEPEVSDY